MSLTNADAVQRYSASKTVPIIAAVGIQLAMFYAFTHGMSIGQILQPNKPVDVVFIPDEPASPPAPIEKVPDLKPQAETIEAPPQPVIDVAIQPDTPPSTVGEGINLAPPADAAAGQKLSITRRNDPPYPAEARRAGQEGTVLLTVIVAPDGSVSAVTVARSSGYTILDDAAVNAVKRWRFTKPAAGSSQVNLPVAFHLQNAG